MPKIVDHDARRTEIAETVARLIARDGLDRVTLQSIASARSCTPGMLLHYFDNKEHVLLSALDWCERRHQHRIKQMVGTRRGASALLQRLLAALPLEDAVALEWRISLQFWSHVPFDPGIRRYYENRNWATFQQGTEDLREAMRRGELVDERSPERIMQELTSLVTGLGVSAIYNPRAYTPAVQRALLEEALQRLRRRDPAPSPSPPQA